MKAMQLPMQLTKSSVPSASRRRVPKPTGVAMASYISNLTGNNLVSLHVSCTGWDNESSMYIYTYNNIVINNVATCISPSKKIVFNMIAYTDSVFSA
jgi:hypothetical protein